MFNFQCRSGKELHNTPIDLFNHLSEGGKFTEYLNQFMQAGSVEALSQYFRKPQNPIPSAAAYAGILRRLLRLVNGPYSFKLHETRVMQIMSSRCPPLLSEASRNEDQHDLATQMELVRMFLDTGRLDPGLEPPVQMHEAQMQMEDEFVEVDGTMIGEDEFVEVNGSMIAEAAVEHS